MATNLGSKLANSACSPSFVTFAFQNGVDYRSDDGGINSGHDLATLFENLDVKIKNHGLGQ